MSKKYLLVAISYLLGQTVLPFIFGIVIAFINMVIFFKEISEDSLVAGVIILSNITVLIFSILILQDEIRKYRETNKWLLKFSDITKGFFTFLGMLVLQILILNLMMLFGVDEESSNTKFITDMVKSSFLTIIFPVFFAPIMEEIVFRKILMNWLKRPLGLPSAMLISSALFAIGHGELSFFPLYLALGLLFSIIYHKTGRIAVTIIGHLFLNLYVVFVMLAL